MSDVELRVPVELVLEWTRNAFEEGPEAASRVEARPWGFTVSRQSRAYLETGDFRAMLVGAGPFIVDGESGEVWATASDPLSYSGDAQHPGWGALDDVATFETWRTRRSPGVANVWDSADPDGADVRLLERHARSQGLLLPFSGDGQIGWSDMEYGWYVEPRQSRWVFRSWSRGFAQDQASFSHLDDALRMLMIQLAGRRQRRTDRPGYESPDVRLLDVDGHPAVRWDGRDAFFLGSARLRDAFVPLARTALRDI